MGIKKLLDTVKQHAPNAYKQVTLKSLHGKRLALDANIFIWRFITAPTGVANKHLQYTYDLVQYLNYHSVQVIFVFDSQLRHAEKILVAHQKRAVSSQRINTHSTFNTHSLVRLKGLEALMEKEHFQKDISLELKIEKTVESLSPKEYRELTKSLSQTDNFSMRFEEEKVGMDKSNPVNIDTVSDTKAVDETSSTRHISIITSNNISKELSVLTNTKSTYVSKSKLKKNSSKIIKIEPLIPLDWLIGTPSDNDDLRPKSQNSSLNTEYQSHQKTSSSDSINKPRWLSSIITKAYQSMHKVLFGVNDNPVTHPPPFPITTIEKEPFKDDVNINSVTHPSPPPIIILKEKIVTDNPNDDSTTHTLPHPITPIKGENITEYVQLKSTQLDAEIQVQSTTSVDIPISTSSLSSALNSRYSAPTTSQLSFDEQCDIDQQLSYEPPTKEEPFLTKDKGITQSPEIDEWVQLARESASQCVGQELPWPAVKKLEKELDLYNKINIDPLTARISLSEHANFLEEEQERLKNHSVRPNNAMFREVQQLLRYLETPYIVSDKYIEAEHLCALLVKYGCADAVATDDTDAAVFLESGNVIRNLFKWGKEPYILDTEELRKALRLSNDAFVDYCILSGCDFSGTIPKVGPTRALKYIQQYGSVEALFDAKPELRNSLPTNWDLEGARTVFTNEAITYQELQEMFERAMNTTSRIPNSSLSAYLNDISIIPFNIGRMAGFKEKHP